MRDPNAADTPEAREKIEDAPALLVRYERIGAKLWADYEESVDPDTRFKNHHGDLKREFSLESGSKATFEWLQHPKLWRPDMWLPSGHMSIVETQEGEVEVTTTYGFGRRVAANTHANDGAIVNKRVYKRPLHGRQVAVSDENLSWQTDALQEVQGILKEIGEQAGVEEAGA